MKTGFALVCLLAVAGCAAETASSNENVSTGTDEAELRVDTALKNGQDRTVDGGPEKWRVAALAKGAKAKVTDESLATCTITENASASTSKRTVFDIAIDYELDDGWNGCTIEFTAPGYKATLDIGENIDD